MENQKSRISELLRWKFSDLSQGIDINRKKQPAENLLHGTEPDSIHPKKFNRYQKMD
jgi:hypothetical protein